MLCDPKEISLRHFDPIITATVRGALGALVKHAQLFWPCPLAVSAFDHALLILFEEINDGQILARR